MTDDFPLASDPVAAAFARLVDVKRPASQSGTRGFRLLEAACYSLLALTAVLAIALAIYASLPL
jgi:hypothetical protein